MLSRFARKRAEEVSRRMEWKVDILDWDARLLSKDVKFQDPAAGRGRRERFGVAHKES